MTSDKLQVHVLNGSRPHEKVIALEGVLNADTAFEFRDIVRKNEAASLVLDMHSLRSMDSSGLGVLIGLYVSFERNNRRLHLAGVNERISDLFHMCKIEGVFRRYSTVADAEAAIPAKGETVARA